MGIPLVWAILLTAILPIIVFDLGYPLQALYLNFIGGVEPNHRRRCRSRLRHFVSVWSGTAGGVEHQLCGRADHRQLGDRETRHGREDLHLHLRYR